MKRNLITKGAPIVALTFLVAFGMISCSSNPMSSPDNGSESYTAGYANDATLLPAVDTNEIVKKGQLVLSQTGCWFLVVDPGERYELHFTGGIPAETATMSATIIGSIEYQLTPVCQQGPVFRVIEIQVN